jgi:hypothetical protein
MDWLRFRFEDKEDNNVGIDLGQETEIDHQGDAHQVNKGLIHLPLARPWTLATYNDRGRGSDSTTVPTTDWIGADISCLNRRHPRSQPFEVKQGE